MNLPPRDRQIVAFTGTFGQVTGAQILAAIFPNTASRTPRDRAIKRLLELGFLARTDRRGVGGPRGGSGEYAYTVGPAGIRQLGLDKRFNRPVINYHTLSIVDAYVKLLEVARAGHVAIEAVQAEPDCWAVVGGVELRPDLFVELALPSLERLKLWLEVDLGSEAQRQVKGKLDAYWRAYNGADVAVWPVFPRVLWVAMDDERAKELAWLVEQGPKDGQGLFDVTTLARLPSWFTS
jgi:hypothetical protein